MATIEYLEKPRSTLVATALILWLFAFIARRREAWRAARLAHIDRVISKGLSAIE
jgi:hypothetical protein